jgi:hypothetical protein
MVSALTKALAMFSCRVLKNALAKKDIGSGMDLPKIRTNNGSQFVSKIFEESIEELGMIHERIPVKTPNMIKSRRQVALPAACTYICLFETYVHKIRSAVIQ